MSNVAFPGLGSHDFDAYLPNKWRSNVFNLERMQVKDKLVQLAREVSPLYPKQNEAPLAVESSVEHPALWNQNQVRCQTVYFLRSEEDRRELYSRITKAKPMASLLAAPSPFREHVHLAIELDAEGLAILLQLYPDASVDRDNAIHKLAEGWHQQALDDRLGELGESFLVSLAGSAPVPPSDPSLSSTSVRSTLSTPSTSGGSLSLGDAAPPLLRIWMPFARSDDRLASADLVPLVQESLEQLIPLYAFFAWSRANDFLAVKEAIREEKKAKRQRGLGPGDTVRVVRGLFTGKRGVITELDSRGGVRVRIGTMVVKLAAEDLVSTA